MARDQAKLRNLYRYLQLREVSMRCIKMYVANSKPNIEESKAQKEKVAAHPERYECAQDRGICEDLA
jgi:hypothetical protein